MKKRAKPHREYVNHPRYGNQPMRSGFRATTDEILSGHWSYNKDSVFIESAIKADTSKQNYSIYPRVIYVDIEKKCIQCKRWFIFYAEEQRYWFEILGFYVDADCVKCIDCRKNEQSIKHMVLDYELLLNKENRTEEETGSLKHIALELFQLGYIRDKNKVNIIT
jgi:hypothetical protein